ncbi:hypothetical protein J6590_033779 [Homalodisca vitripennis]|nr:hypothetical protein J6590_033779 [Homalodisca vitripennis]
MCPCSPLNELAALTPSSMVHDQCPSLPPLTNSGACLMYISPPTPRCMRFESMWCIMCEGGVPAGGTANVTNHNHSGGGGGGGTGGGTATASNFKRQNTVDSATIKENTARLNSRGPTKNANLPVLDTMGPTDGASPGKPRVTKSNTMQGGNRVLAPGGSVGRRSTISYEAKASSNEKTNTAGDTPSALDTRAAKGHIKSASISTSSGRPPHELDPSLDPLRQRYLPHSARLLALPTLVHFAA